MVSIQLQNEELQMINITKMIYRLKTRLALANFKRQYGYERYDLCTLENNLLLKKKQHSVLQKRKILLAPTGRHRYYPTTTTTTAKKIITPSIKQQQGLYLSYPLSEKRSTSPLQQHKSIIPTDEDAANMLVMLHNMS
ncbi:unnamed protein product [Mucor hiemalis]